MNTPKDKPIVKYGPSVFKPNTDAKTQPSNGVTPIVPKHGVRPIQRVESPQAVSQGIRPIHNKPIQPYSPPPSKVDDNKSIVKKNTLGEQSVGPSTFKPSPLPQSVPNKKPAVIASASMAIGTRNQSSVASGYTDSVVNNYGQFSLEEYERIKKKVENFDIKSIQYVLSFGEETQRAYAYIASEMLALNANNLNGEMDKHLNSLLKTIQSFGHDELTGNVGVFKTIAFAMSNISIKERLERAIAEVDVSVHYIENTLSTLYERIQCLEQIEDRYKVLDKDLNCDIIALKIVKEYIESHQANNSDNDYLMSKTIADRTSFINSRIDSLLQTSIGGQLTPSQTSLMKQTFVSKAENARNTILTLVSSWKSYCSSALSMIENSGHKNIGGLAGDILAVRDKITVAIENK